MLHALRATQRVRLFHEGEELVLHRQTDQPAAQRLAWRCRHIPLPPAGRPIVVAGCEAIHTYAVIRVTVGGWTQP